MYAQMYALYRDPEGKRVFDKTLPSEQQGSNGKGPADRNMRRASEGFFSKSDKVRISLIFVVFMYVHVACYTGCDF